MTELPKEKRPGPRRRQDSSFIAKWTFAYMSPIIKQGLSRILDMDDFLPLEECDDAEALSSKLSIAWKSEQQSTARPSLRNVTLRVFRVLVVSSGAAYFLEMIAKIGEVLVLGALLNWFQNPSAELGDGFAYGVTLFLLSLMHSIMHHVEFFLAMRCGMQIRVAFIAAIYKKCLSLSTSHTSSTGLIVNLVSNDVQRFEDAAPFAHFIWLGPLEVVLMTYFMYTQIGFASFAAVGALLALIPIQGYFARVFARLRKRTVSLRDERIKNISDSLAGMLVVKLYAWEEAFEKTINGVRDTELWNIRKASFMRASNEALFFASGSLIEIFAFITFWLIGGVFTPAKIFTSIAYMSSIKLSMTNFFPKALQFLSESRVSMDRIQNFLALPDIHSHRESERAQEILRRVPADADIIIENGSFGWEANDDESQRAVPILRDINVHIKIGELVAVVGPVGSGKSSILSAILGEMTAQGTKSGIAVRSKSIAYCSQTPYILSGTIRDNITFGKQYDEKRFTEVVCACAMDRDLEMFQNSDLTVIGERGVTLSGGQRARLALARAVYSDADIYLLDDPLSAVDTKVGRHLFEECISHFLRSKTRILVTHQLQFAKQCERVLVLENGLITADGSFADVIKVENSIFANAMKDLETEKLEDGEAVDELIVDKKDTFVIEDAVAEAVNNSGGTSGNSPLIIKEEMAKGSVPPKIYWEFFRSGAALWQIFGLIILMIIGQVSLVVTDFYLSKWSQQSESSQREIRNVGIFLGLAIGTLAISFSRAQVFFYLCLNSTAKLFRKMLNSVYRSPMSFFQQNPHGRLMNRFSKDVNLADEMLPLTFFDFSQCAFLIIGTFAVAVAIVPYVLVTIPIIVSVFVYLLRLYLATSRQVKRLEATTRSPIYTMVPSTLEGLATIRAFQCESRFGSEFMAIQNDNTRMYFSFLSSARWLGFRLDCLSSFFLGLISIGTAALKGSAGSAIGVNSGTVGLLLTYSLQLVGTLQWAVRQAAEVETQMVSVERILEYSVLEPEAPMKTAVTPPDNWPTAGDLEITKMSMAYPTNPGKKILNDVTVHIPGGMKVGVVGRTGAGKSSLLQVLFRLVEPTPANSIVLDGIPTSGLGLYDLRSRISIIPQEPFCFKGTLRYNLDPFSAYDDAKLWSALESVELKASVESLPEGLDSPVAENGSNWSVGERQLICLARAILRNSKLIVLDEATSAVDMRTDALVQKAIRSSTGLFASSTVLCIAHRLQTIIDFDRVMVLDFGKIVEYGSPHELLQKDADRNPDAWFSRMVAQMGEDAQKQLRAAAFLKWSEPPAKELKQQIVAAAASAFAATLTVSTGTTYQTIDGFGGMDGWTSLSNSVIDTAYGSGSSSLGLTILRCRLSDAQSDWSSIATSVKEAYAKNPNVKVFATIWAPPASLLTTLSSDPAGCNIAKVVESSSWAAYATYLNSFITYMKNNGAPLYAIGVQNEPDWEWTCWTAANMRDWLKEYGNTITGALVISPEPLGMSATYLNTILSDSAAAANVDIVGGHLYGATPYSFNSLGKPVWMTEHLLNSNVGWAETMTLAAEINNCMNVGWSAYVYWYTQRYYGFIGDGTEGSTNGAVLPRGWMFSLWAKNVLPGYKRVAISGSSSAAYSAFAGSGKVVVMVINSGSATSETFEVPEFSSVSATVVSEAQQTVSSLSASATTSTSATFTIPASAVVAIVFTTGSSSGGATTTKAPATTAATTKAAATTKTAAATTAAGSSSCAAKYGQCGGSVLVRDWNKK
ncbi:Multidrug resistance-associated protein 4 [Entophlyctis luteolus]|nr:Multidrug resistance-associated protein 4 [Entophlyctis luteolus]